MNQLTMRNHIDLHHIELLASIALISIPPNCQTLPLSPFIQPSLNMPWLEVIMC